MGLAYGSDDESGEDGANKGGSRASTGVGEDDEDGGGGGGGGKQFAGSFF